MLQPFEFFSSYKKITTMRTLILPFLLILTLVFSCRSEDYGLLEKKVNFYDVYVTGDENNEACYWKNTIKTVLTGGTNYKALNIFVNNNDVYILGMNENSINTGRDYCYWKNNVKQDVTQYLGIQANTPVSENFSMSNFFIENGDLYIAGFMKNPAATNPQNQYQFCYWKNGIKTVVFEQNDYQTSASMHLIGNDIYVPLENNIVNNPSINWDLGYYKNGVYNFIGNNSNFAGFHKENGSLKMLVSDHNSQTIYYKDLNSGVISTPPPFINYAGDRYSSQIDGNNQYFVGRHNYYKNNTQFNLHPPGSSFSYLNDFKVLDDNIYKILHSDDNTGVNYNVYINDVIVQSAQNPSNNLSTQFLNLTVVPN